MVFFFLSKLLDSRVEVEVGVHDIEPILPILDQSLQLSRHHFDEIFNTIVKSIFSQFITWK